MEEINSSIVGGLYWYQSSCPFYTIDDGQPQLLDFTNKYFNNLSYYHRY